MNRRMDRVTGEEATIYTPPEDVVEVPSSECRWIGAGVNRRLIYTPSEKYGRTLPPEVTNVSPDEAALSWDHAVPDGVVQVVTHLAGVHQDKVGTCPWCESLTVATKRGYEAALNFKRCPS